MTQQQSFPEIQAATQALEQRIRLTEPEIEQMAETILQKEVTYQRTT